MKTRILALVLSLATAAAHAMGPIGAPPRFGTVTVQATVKIYHALPKGSLPQGKTAAQVKANFGPIINANFAAANINTVFSRMTDPELAALSKVYLHQVGTLAPLAKVAAQHLTAPNLVRFAGAAGSQVVGLAVSSYAPTAIESVYYRLNPHMAIAMSVAAKGVSVAPASPSLGMTLEEIYLEYRTSAYAMEALEALYATSLYASAALSTSAAGGYAIGNGILWVGDQLDPNFSTDLSSFLGANIATTIDFLVNPDPTDVSEWTANSPTGGQTPIDFEIFGPSVTILVPWLSPLFEDQP